MTTIASAFAEVTKSVTGSAPAEPTIAGQVNALADALGSEAPAGKTIASAVQRLDGVIGSGGGGGYTATGSYVAIFNSSQSKSGLTGVRFLFLPGKTAADLEGMSGADLYSDPFMIMQTSPAKDLPLVVPGPCLVLAAVHTTMGQSSSNYNVKATFSSSTDQSATPIVVTAGSNSNLGGRYWYFELPNERPFPDAPGGVNVAVTVNDPA